MHIRTNPSITLLNFALMLQENLNNLECLGMHYQDIVSIVRGDKEKSNPMDFSKIALPRVIIEEKADFTYKAEDNPLFINYMTITNPITDETKSMSGKSLSYGLEFEISVYSKDLEESKRIAMSLTNFINSRKSISLDASLFDNGIQVGTIKNGESIVLVSTEIAFSHEAIEETIVYKLHSEIKYKLHGLQYSDGKEGEIYPNIVLDKEVNGIYVIPGPPLFIDCK